MFYVYRYVYNHQIIYVGKTKRDLCVRISEHKVERKFLPYLTADIEYIVCKTHVEMDIYEKYYINVYSPILNVTDMCGASFDFKLPEQTWLPYQEHQWFSEQQSRIPNMVSKIDPEIIRLQEEIEELESKLTVLENFEALLEKLFDDYINDNWDLRSGYVYYDWDMISYPLPDAIEIDGDTYGCYVASCDCGSGRWQNKIPERIARIFLKSGRDSYKKEYQQIRGQILDLEYELEKKR